MADEDAFRKDLVRERRVSAPRQPEEPPPTRLRLTMTDPSVHELAELAEAAGQSEFNPLKHATVVLMTEDMRSSAFLSSCDDDILASVQACLGIYYNTNLEHCGGFVWKSIHRREVGGVPINIYMFRTEDGWYAADTVWRTATQRKQFQEMATILWWAESVGADFEDVPGAPLHFPWWSSSESDGVSIVYGHDLMLLKDADVVVKRGGTPEGDNGQTGGGDDADGSTDAPKGGKGKEPPRGKGGHGGWMPRCATLISTYEQQDWTAFEWHASEFKQGSFALRKLLGEQ